MNHDSGGETTDQRIIIFSTATLLRHLNTSDQLFGDDSFTLSPPLFDQLYSIHGHVSGSLQPMICDLLPRRTEDIYKILLQTVKVLASLLRPKHFMCDFEHAIINAVRSEFNLIIVTVFSFFPNCLWKF